MAQLGPQLIITAVMMAANTALTAMRTIEGPRLQDTKATLADYGTPLNYFVGTRMIPCPCFFSKPIQEVKKKRKGKGGKQVTYTGYGTFAIHIADHEITNVLQVWFDNHLVYDATGSGEKTYPLGDGYELTASMRTYLGTETQDPDPDMQAYIEARDGAGTCPAYRGTSYIYFENIPLQLLGNRYPDVKVLAENSTEGTLAYPDTADIELVGEMEHEVDSGFASGDVSFALTGGLASTPAAGDLVLIVVMSSSLSTDIDHDVPASIVGYTTLFSPLDVTGDFNHAGFCVYYKFMGETPDTTWSSPDTRGTNGSTSYQVVVLRGVDSSDMLASTVETTSDANAVDCVPADITVGGNTIDPGFINLAVARRIMTASFALNSTTGQVLPMFAAGLSNQTSATVPFGNFIYGYRANSASARSTSSLLAWGREVLVGGGATLKDVLTLAAQGAGLESDEYDFSLALQPIPGYNWTQGTGRQICEALCDLHDVDLRPHDFTFQAWPRGGESAGAITTGEFVAERPAFKLTRTAESDLPSRVFLVYADTESGQNPNVATPSGPPGSNETTIDMQTLALDPETAQQLSERTLRRLHFGRVKGEFGLTRQYIGIEPGDVWTPAFDDDAMTMRCKKVVIGADGKMPGEWERDDPAIASLSGSAGAVAAGWVDEAVPDTVATIGDVLDTAFLVDAHDQSAPLAYLVAGPAEPGVWTGSDFAQSETGELDSYTEQWDGIAAGDAAIIGTTAEALPDVEPWVPDMGSSLTVTINVETLTSATLDDLLLDPTRNLAAIQSGDGWELVQFMTPTLTGTKEYTITGFLRGVRGTEWAMAGHAIGDRFILLENAKRRTLGASEIGDEDWYIAAPTGQNADQDDAFSVTFTGASHKPYAPVFGEAEQSGADWVFDATRRTRIGGATLDGQDVPLGEASESWALDIMDGATVVRTITGTSLPLTYTEAQQIADWSGALGAAPEANLYQVNPTLTLRGYPLNFPEGPS